MASKKAGGSTKNGRDSQSKRLGAEDVTIVYRRGPDKMGASAFERELAEREREELNALYVALTRARRQLVLSAAEPASANASSTANRLSPAKPCIRPMFIMSEKLMVLLLRASQSGEGETIHAAARPPGRRPPRITCLNGSGLTGNPWGRDRV